MVLFSNSKSLEWKNERNRDRGAERVTDPWISFSFQTSSKLSQLKQVIGCFKSVTDGFLERRHSAYHVILGHIRGSVEVMVRHNVLRKKHAAVSIILAPPLIFCSW